MPAWLTWICHASTDAVRNADFPDDEPLDAQGAARAAGVNPLLRRPDRAWTAPELRTRQTAEALGLAARTEKALRDCDYGRWRGRSLADVQAAEPAGLVAWLNDPASAPHGGESVQD